MKKFTPRPIRFIEIFKVNNWKIKIYSICYDNVKVATTNIDLAKQNLDKWLAKSTDYDLENYKIATLILHEFDGDCYAIINWWTDENMLQHFVYLSDNKDIINYKLYSEKGIITCVWELEILWHERNSWINHILKNEKPDFESYLNEQLNLY